jgi:hypothetical protein
VARRWRRIGVADREHILAVLRDTDWVLGGPKGAASRLGTKRSTLHWKTKKLDISRPQSRPTAGTRPLALPLPLIQFYCSLGGIVLSSARFALQ